MPLRTWMPEVFMPYDPADTTPGRYLLRLLAGQGRSPFGIQPGLDQTLGMTVPTLGMPVSQPSRAVGRMSEGRPILPDPTHPGYYNSHLNMIANMGGRERLFPTMYGGQYVTPDDAMEVMRRSRFVDPDTGMRVPSFATVPEAEAYETTQHGGLEQEMLRALRQLGVVPQEPQGLGR